MDERQINETTLAIKYLAGKSRQLETQVYLLFPVFPKRGSGTQRMKECEMCRKMYKYKIEIRLTQ